VRDGKGRGEVAGEERVRRALEDGARDAHGVLDAAQPGHGAGFHGDAVHDHGVERRLARFVWRPAVADGAVALIRLADGAPCFDGVEGRAALEEGCVGCVGGGDERTAPCVDRQREARAREWRPSY
ncbi:hypothetical protein BN1723_016972, partial [Verticillium longisporum]